MSNERFKHIVTCNPFNIHAGFNVLREAVIYAVSVTQRYPIGAEVQISDTINYTLFKVENVIYIKHGAEQGSVCLKGENK